MLELNRVTSLQAYRQELVQSYFVGLSSETKPTTGADSAALGAGSVFRELDTALEWWWDGLRWNPPVDTLELKALARLERLLETLNLNLRELSRTLDPFQK